MTFLYSSIGILLFSSIFFINKQTIIFSKYDHYSDYYNSKYFSSKAQQIDKFILNVIHNKNTDLGYNDEICFNIMSSLYTSGLLNKDEIDYVVYSNTNSKHSKLRNSCVLTNGSHRILIKRVSGNENKYSLNSCILSNKQKCNFENDN